MIELTNIAAPEALLHPLVQVRACRFHYDGNGVTDGVSAPAGTDVPILPESMTRAVAKRQAEFLAGRLAASAALRSLGASGHVPVGEDRSPQWPAGIVGSISHTDRLAIAVVARATQCAGLGIDIEPVMDSDTVRNLQHMIARPEELALQPKSLSLPQFLTLLFSAKEALYKAVFPRLQQVLEFHDARLLGVRDNTLQLALCSNDLPGWARQPFNVSSCLTDGLGFSWCYQLTPSMDHEVNTCLI
ncbi:4'-phosphopantetheinyl transferase [Leeia sp.]|uniref:4'-phosphopantetheinyl transferase family protein n=1 Tax=Leeia sp. TaxID=2884678 RepID=UPI0035B20242